MDLPAEKLDLIQWLTQLTDEKVIRQVKALRNKNSNAYKLSATHKSIIDERIANHEANSESGSTWEDARQRITSK
jgi:hypothetical protein